MPPTPGVARPIHSYAFSAVNATISLGSNIPAAITDVLHPNFQALFPLRFSNYGTDGGLSFTFPSDKIEHENSADGFVTISAQIDERVELTVTLKDSSSALPYLSAMAYWQSRVMALGLNPPPMYFEMLDPATGDSVSSTRMIFVGEATPDKARNSGEREFKILLPYGRYKCSLGGNNIGYGNIPDALASILPDSPATN